MSSESPTMGTAGVGSRPCQGLYYAPGRKPKAALLASHYEVDMAEHYLAGLMAARGYGFLGWNTRYRGLGAAFRLEHALVDVGVGVRWLRERAGAEVVVLLGNSGGASLLAAYQAQAAAGALPPAPGELTLPAVLGELVPADLFVSLNAHRGRPDVLTSYLDPAVVDETDPLVSDPDLDMFDPGHGPPYPQAFVTRYRAAQVARNRRIAAWARAELERTERAGAYDRVFAVHRTWADLRFLDVSLDPSERAPGCYLGDPRWANFSPFGLAAASTLRGFLEMWSLEDSRCRAEPHLSAIRCPALVVQSLGDQGCFPSDATAIFEALGSADKHLEFVPGDHYFTTPAGAREAVADLIASWIEQRC